jgi:hypothetical protein
MRAKSTTPSQFTLDHVAPFVANLRSNVVAPHSTGVGEPSGTTLPLDVQGTLLNNRNNEKWHSLPVRTLGWVRCPREEGSERCATKTPKRLKKSIGPIQDGPKKRMLAEFDSSESQSDDGDDGLSEGNNETNHAEALDNSSYSEGDE